MQMRYCDIQRNIESFVKSLIPYRRFGDFQTLASLPRPRPLQLHIEPHIFYGHFRAWLRKQGFNPNRGPLHQYEMRLANAERKEEARPTGDSTRRYPNGRHPTPWAIPTSAPRRMTA
jgi:hypothetical protein